MCFKKHSILFFFLLALFFTNYSWAQTPPKLTAVGAQIYCPLSELPIVTDFGIIPGDEEIKAVYIQISTGYIRGEDLLNLSGTYPNIAVQPFNILEGKLELRWTGTGNAVIAELISAVKNVKFKSTSITPSGSRTFSITIGEANYLPSTGHYYEYVAALRITWKEAKIAAENKLYYGRQGYLATITTKEEAVLSGEQAAGQGWIGGSDEETEGVWKWVTGPEAGMVFWNGLANGSSPPGVYYNWATGEPNDWPNANIPKEENYAHIYETGKWNDYPNFNNDIKGYVVEYGKPGDLPLNISASTTISVAAITATTPATRCGAGTVPLSASATSGATVLWFDAPTSTTPINSGPNYAPILSTTKTYYVLASANGCVTGQRTAVIATVNPLPIIQSAIEFKNCDEDGNADGFNDFNLNEVTTELIKNDASLTVTYHLNTSDANTSPSANPINPVPFNNGTANTVYARVQNAFGCFSVSTVKLSVSSTLLPTGFNYELSACDRDANADGFFAFNLTQASTVFINKLPAGQPLSVHYYRTLDDAQLEQNEIPSTNYINETKDSQILFVRIENENDGNCFGIGPFLTLTVQEIPQFEVNSTAVLCLYLPPITLETFNPEGNYTYQWTNANGLTISNNSFALVSTAGIYTVIATSDLNCESYEKTVTVTESQIPDITLNDVIVIEDSKNNSITINTQNNNLGIGDFEFSLNAPLGPFQDAPYFENLAPGNYTLAVRDKSYCGIAYLNIVILAFPKFFTPNDDGYNDTWKVLGNDLNSIKISAIYIFDRFGKLVAEVDLNGEGWDGFYNGERLPASDYWYLVKYTDQYGDYRGKRGNVSLIRR